MTEPFAHAEFQGELNLPHYMMAGYNIEVPDIPRADQYAAEITLRFLVDGPVRMVAATSLTVGAARVLAAQIQQRADDASRLWGSL